MKKKILGVLVLLTIVFSMSVITYASEPIILRPQQQICPSELISELTSTLNRRDANLTQQEIDEITMVIDRLTLAYSRGEVIYTASYTLTFDDFDTDARNDDHTGRFVWNPSFPFGDIVVTASFFNNGVIWTGRNDSFWESAFLNRVDASIRHWLTGATSHNNLLNRTVHPGGQFWIGVDMDMWGSSTFSLMRDGVRSRDVTAHTPYPRPLFETIGE